MMLRVQAERMHGAFFPSSREYAVRYGLSERRAALLPEHAVVLHPGPMVRGMEIAPAVADAAVERGAGAGAERGARAHGRPLPPARGSCGMTAVLLVSGSHLLHPEPRRRPLDERRPADPRRPALRRGRARRRPGPRRGRRRDRAGPCRIGVGGVGETLDADGLVLLPGLVDLHTHLREPGGEESETVATGSAAAALGGYTAVFAMPNTDPVADSAVVVEHVRRLGEEVGLVDVHPVGAVTVGLAGERMAELGTMAASRARVRVFSDDGRCVHDPVVMRRALEYASSLDAVIAQHAEDHRLTAGAQAHEGVVAAQLGLAGWPATAEETIVARDCALAREAGARLHVCHVSSAHTIAVLRAAKAAGVRVTAEVTPHHLLLTDAALRRLRPRAQGQPAAAHRRRHRGDAGGAGRGRDRRRGHRPRPARHAVQGHRVGGRAAGHAGAADGAVGGGARLRRDGAAGLARGRPRDVRAPGARSAGWPTRAARSRSGSRRRSASSTPTGSGRCAARRWPAGRRTRPTRACGCRRRWPRRCCAVGSRRATEWSAPMERGPGREGQWHEQRRRTAGARGRPGLPRRALRRRRADPRRGRVLHGDDRLPGDADRPQLPRPDRRRDRPADRQHRLERRGRRVGAHPGGRLRGARPVADGVELALAPVAGRRAGGARGSSASRGSTPARWSGTCASGGR